MIREYASKILIYGVGLMGSSLAIDIRKADSKVHLTGIVRSLKSKKICESLKVFDHLFTEEEFLKQSERIWNQFDFVIIGTSVSAVKSIVRRIPHSCRAVLTDMGSTKQTIIDAVESHYSGRGFHNYVSSHPMCGSENAGPENAIPDLYRDKLCIITPLPSSDSDSVQKVMQFWKDLGMITYSMAGTEHDRVLAVLSHSPHILSSVLVIWAEKEVGKENQLSPRPIMGGGFRDMARIAGSNPEMWQSIVGENQDFILKSLKSFQDHLQATIECIETGNPELWKHFFHSAFLCKKNLFRDE